METLYSYFKEQVIQRPDATAIIDGDRRITFASLDGMACAIAATFPVSRPRAVGIVADHGAMMIASILAVLKTGAAYVPVEPSFPDERIRFVMRECGVDFIITYDRYRSRLDGFTLLTVAPDTAVDGQGTDGEDHSRPEDVAYVLYTSGSTGKPKGVAVENRNVCHYVKAFRHEFNPHEGDVMLQYSVCSFDIFVEEVFTSILSGAALAIPPENVKGDINTLMEYVESHGVTMISGFPYLLLEMNKLPRIPHTLRLLISGGDVLRESYVNNLLPKVTVYNTYGPSETTVCATYYRCNGGKAQPDGTYPIGKAVLGSRVEIRDEALRPVQNGTVGEICIFGEGVSRGYVGKRNVENRAFVTLPDGRRMYRSGDMGIMLDDGTVLFMHRKDEQVMILGRRVETCEVQNILCECKDIESGVVRSNTDEQGMAYLTAYIVPRQDTACSLTKVKDFMAKFLPQYMLPEFFVSMKTMPLTPNGKVDMRALPVVMKAGSL